MQQAASCCLLVGLLENIGFAVARRLNRPVDMLTNALRYMIPEHLEHIQAEIASLIETDSKF